MAQSFEQARIDERRDTPSLMVIQDFDLAVWPEPRLLIVKGIAGLILGGGGAVVVGFLLARLLGRPGVAAAATADIHGLLAETWRDVLHPWKLAARVLGFDLLRARMTSRRVGAPSS